MKIILREWMRDRTASIGWILYVVILVSYSAINAKFVIIVSNAVTNFDKLTENLVIIGFWSLVQIFLAIAIGYLDKYVPAHLFTSISTSYSNKVIDGDAAMFVKYSCSYIITIFDFCDDVCKIGMACFRLVYNVSNLIIIIISLYIVGGLRLIPVIIIYMTGIVLMRTLYKSYEKINKKVHEFRKQRNQELENIVNGFAELRSFGTQEYHRNRFYEFNTGSQSLTVKKGKIGGLIDGGLDLIDGIGLMVTMVIISKYLLPSGIANNATAMAIVMYVFRIISPMINIMDFSTTLSDSLAKVSDYNKIINYENQNWPSRTVEMDRVKKGITINNLSFGYDGNTVLNDVTIEIPKGKKIGICGKSGNGKSTLVKLLNRYYLPDSGCIFIDDLDLYRITNESYHKLVGAVQQDHTIFPGTILENLKYGSFNASESDIMDAAKKSNIYEFIMSLPDKFETLVGPRGLKLSGGQKQRIALARVLLADPEVIILDEATSALDNECETIIQNFIDHLDGKTIITIAHRLSTIRNSDIIYVLGENGTVVESGTHEELMKLCGEYFSLNK